MLVSEQLIVSSEPYTFILQHSS